METINEAELTLARRNDATFNAHGGNDQSDLELGEAAWSTIMKLLRLPS